jgi:EpsI family protein
MNFTPAPQPPVRPGAPPAARATGRRWWGVATACLALVVAGAGYRAAAAYIGGELAQKVRLPTPLASLPLAIGDWQGEDMPLSAGVQRIAGNDDFVNRQYVHRRSGQRVSLYVGYTARPRTMLRHRPTVCYPSAGFSLLGTRERLVPIAGQSRPVRLHAFLQPSGPEYRVLVLNFYLLNGVWTVDEDSFWSLGWRTPNLARDATRYVAQIQVSCVLTSSEEAATADVVAFIEAVGPQLLALLPDADRGAADAAP